MACGENLGWYLKIVLNKFNPLSNNLVTVCDLKYVQKFFDIPLNGIQGSLTPPLSMVAWNLLFISNKQKRAELTVCTRETKSHKYCGFLAALS